MKKACKSCVKGPKFSTPSQLDRVTKNNTKIFPFCTS